MEREQVRFIYSHSEVYVFFSISYGEIEKLRKHRFHCGWKMSLFESALGCRGPEIRTMRRGLSNGGALNLTS